jgi:hypothetical protein
MTSGLTVDIKPSISNRGLVEMEVAFENSQSFTVANIGNGIPGIGTTADQAQTFLEIPSGETRVIGGLISRDHEDTTAGVPILSQLPWIGFLFGNKDKSDTTRNLMFFVTPTIIDDKPQNDIIMEPVNEVARLNTMLGGNRAVAPPKNVNPVPRELMPYLEQIRPEAIPMPLNEEQGTTVSTVRKDEGSTLSLSTTETSVTASVAGKRLLTDKPYIDTNPLPPELKIGGAVQTLNVGGAAGPSGVFGQGTGTKTASSKTHKAPSRSTTASSSPKRSGSRGGLGSSQGGFGTQGGGFGSSSFGGNSTETSYH